MRPLNGIKDEAYKAAAELLKPGGRAASNRYLVEGENLVRKALASPSPVHAVYATPDEAPQLRDLCRDAGVPLYVAGGGLMPKLVGTGYETAVTALAPYTPSTVNTFRSACTPAPPEESELPIVSAVRMRHLFAKAAL